MKKYRIYQGERYSLLEVDGECCVLGDVYLNKYYRISCSFEEIGMPVNHVKEYRVQILDCVVFMLWLFTPIVLRHMIVKLFQSRCFVFNNIGMELIISGILFIGNIVIHEVSHFFAMKYYKLPNARFGYRKEKRRIKLYVDTTSAYLLPTYKQFVVYSIGILINLYCIYFTNIICTYLQLPCIVVNVLPIVFLVLNLIPFRGDNNDLVNIIFLTRRNIINKNRREDKL